MNLKEEFKNWNLLDWWFKPHDVRFIRAFEWLVCVAMLYYFGNHLQEGEWWLTEKGFHVSAAGTSSHYLTPPPLVPAEWLTPLSIAFYSLGGIYLLGYGRRVLNWVFFALCVYIQAVDQPSSFTINRMLIIYFLFLGLQPPAEEIDRRKMVSGWLIRIFQLTLVFQYFGAGICKWYGGNWMDNVGGGLFESMNYVIWSQSQGHYKNEISAWAINVWPPFLWGMFAWGALAVETFSPVLFFMKSKPVRHAALFAGFMMHMGIAILMKDLIYFSLQMVCSYVFFLPESWVVYPFEKIKEKLPFL